MDEKRKDERRRPLSDAEKLQLGTVLPQEQRENDRRSEQSDRDAQKADRGEKEPQ
jgi:hypothetical protein